MALPKLCYMQNVSTLTNIPIYKIITLTNTLPPQNTAPVSVFVGMYFLAC